jgi:hypothetical protein
VLKLLARSVTSPIARQPEATNWLNFFLLLCMKPYASQWLVPEQSVEFFHGGFTKLLIVAGSVNSCLVITWQSNYRE